MKQDVFAPKSIHEHQSILVSKTGFMIDSTNSTWQLPASSGAWNFTWRMMEPGRELTPIIKGYLAHLWEERWDRLRMTLMIHLEATIPDRQVIHLGNLKRKHA